MQKKQMRFDILRACLPAIPLARLSAVWKKVAEEMTAGPRKDVCGLIGATRAPGAYIRWDVKVPFRLAEMAGLKTARDGHATWELQRSRYCDANVGGAVRRPPLLFRCSLAAHAGGTLVRWRREWEGNAYSKLLKINRYL
jgi:hypothetical protein